MLVALQPKIRRACIRCGYLQHIADCDRQSIDTCKTGLSPAFTVPNFSVPISAIRWSCLLVNPNNTWILNSAMTFTSTYGGESVYGAVNSSIQFAWSFSGGIGIVAWGLKHPNINDISDRLLLFSRTGEVLQVTPPGVYTGRVSGVFSGNASSGQVVFTLSNITKEDERFYACRITSPDLVPVTKFDFVQLVIEEEPRITFPDAVKKSYYEGSPVNVSCTATGKPEPDVRWIHTGQVKTSGSYATHLTFSKITRADAGMYTCRANNSAGTKEQHINLEVQYTATIHVHNITSSASKSWIGQAVTLRCISDGVPTPNITWTKPNGDEVKKVTAEKNMVTVVMKADEDFGSYTCKADNGVGDASMQRVQVQQIKAPGPPSITSAATDIQSTSLTVKWAAPTDDGGSPITAYRVVILQEGNVMTKANITDPATREIFIGGLKRNTDYNIKLYVRNYVFEGDALQKAFKTKIQGVPLAADIKGLPVKTKEVQVTIEWNEPQNNGVPITQYTVYQRTLRDDGNLSPWKKIKNTYDVSVRQAAVNLEKGKQYEFVVTATNKFGESYKEAGKIKRIKVLGDVPTAVKQKEIRYAEVTLKWDEPVNNGANITQYSIYQRIGGDKQWKTLAVTSNLSRREYVAKVAKDKGYEFVVTATNKHGESPKENIETVKISEVLNPPPETQAETQKPERECHSTTGEELIPMSPIANQEWAGAQLSVEEQKGEEPKYEIPGGGDYMPLHPSTRSWEISREQVDVIKIIGKGAFSEVAKATVLNLRDNRRLITVAAKMLKDNAPASDRKDLLSELELMTKLKPHPHVTKLIGCVTEGEPLLVLIEYVPFGDLLGYLRKSRGLNDTYYKDPDVKPQTNLTSEQLMKFAWQVADGMCYLSSRKIIHRDLAARNVLVGEGEKCKVTDFGMARNLHQDDIYSRKSRGRLPVKWTAYEALVFGIYTTKSDVWSYGILLYEILTVGGAPYPDMNARQIAHKLQEGYRMPRPTHVDNKLYEIMLKCWEEQPNDRPSFEKLRKTMKGMEKNHKTYVNLSQYDNSLYANVQDLADE